MKLRYVLSLFDGMSGAQIAMKELGLAFEKYYASEIDPYAIKQTQLNFPNTIQLGDINNWRDWDIEWERIDLILAGSPCQGFSFAGSQLMFNDPRSKLFFVFIDILNYVKSVNSKVKFLLENVQMSKNKLRINPLRIISDYVGIKPVNINSNLVSAQNRNRYYWSNIKTKQTGLLGTMYTDIPQPKDEGLVIWDIIDKKVDKKYYVSDFVANRFKKLKQGDNIVGTTRPAFRTIGQMDIVYGLDGKVGTITESIYKQPSVILIPTKTSFYLRRLTPTECARAQTIPDWYVWQCSDKRIYSLIGNGWTIKVIMHILKYLI
jgi:DNA-cytosine methyltransferase